MLIDIYGYLTVADDLHFGSKKKLVCPSALFVLRQVVIYFSERNSNVYIASLDASKAFDWVNNYKLFSTLISNNLPVSFCKANSQLAFKDVVCNKCNDFYSSAFSVHSGVRQGSVLTLMLFNQYANTILPV